LYEQVREVGGKFRWLDESSASSRDSCSKRADGKGVGEVPWSNDEDKPARFGSEMRATDVREQEAALWSFSFGPLLHMFDVVDDIVMHCLETNACFELRATQILVKCVDESLMIIGHQPIQLLELPFAVFHVLGATRTKGSPQCRDRFVNLTSG
jgi:hypothetical protein